MKKILILCTLLLTLGGCSSVELEKGPGVEEIYYGGSTSSESGRIESLRSSLIPNPRFTISDPMMPIVKAPLSLPVYVRGKRTDRYQEEGRWVHEIVEPGGYIN